jgi:hypothetical protein
LATSVTKREAFLRFVTDRIDPDSHVAQGLFGAAYALRDEGVLEEHERVWFAEVVGWFEQHLHVPKHFDLDLPSCAKAERGRVIYWFKASAQQPIQRMRQVATMLRHHGVGTRVLRTVRPGHVVYEDASQVGAIPWRDGVR